MELTSPLNVHWELTNVCNLRCVHCYQQDDAQRHPLPTGNGLFTIAQRIIDASVFEVTLTGGEPLLVPQLPDLVSFFNRHNIRPHITSNGMLVDSAAANWLSSAAISFQVSLDAADPEIHNKIRGSRRAFSDAVAGIGRLVAQNVDVSIAYCAMPTNFDEISSIVELAADLGVRKVCVGEVLPYFGAASRRSSLAFDKSGYANFVKSLNVLTEGYRGKVDVQVALMSGHIYDSTLRNAPCTALERDLAILHDGWAYPCPFVRSPRYRLGNLLDRPIAEIWNSEIARNFRAEKKAGAAKHCTTDASPNGPVLIDMRPTRRISDPKVKQRKDDDL